MKVGSLFAGIPETLPQELFETLLSAPSFKLERIVSAGHATAAGEWYDQDRDEWVLVLRGCALLRFESEPVPLELAAGDYVLIPAHCRHRVEWTSGSEKTVWLALHCSVRSPLQKIAAHPSTGPA